MTYEEKLQKANSLRDGTITIREDGWPQWYADYETQVEQEVRMVPVPGYPDLKIHVIRPKGQTSPLPLCVDIHGGGFVKPLYHRGILLGCSFAVRMNFVVIEVDYCLAPEHPFPAAVYQVAELMSYVDAHTDDLRVNKDQIIYCGHSAGATLAVSATLLHNRSASSSMLGIISDYGAFDNATDPADRKQVPGDPLSVEVCRTFNALYLEDPEKDGRDPLASPVLADRAELAKLPPVMFITVGRDQLKYDSDAFMLRLVDAGVPIQAKRFENSGHGMNEYCLDEWEDAHALMIKTMLSWVNEANCK